MSKNNSFGENEDEVVRLGEYINGKNEELEQANLILEASEGDNCTYSMGYMKRQALYACITCTEDGQTSGAICLPCMYQCHDNHELVELWTKRNYRCDCGSDKFKTKCELEPNKSEPNDLNIYNQNFKGLYCTCSRPYPDPNEENNDEMIQCIICEDWYHSKHLGTKDMNPNDYSEMICSECTSKLSFLLAYKHLMVVDDSKKCLEDDENLDINVEDTENDTSVNAAELLITKSDIAHPSCSNGECKLNTTKKMSSISGSSFWVEGWRNELCTCVSCNEIYKKEGISFITDPQDTLQAYENKSRERMSAKEKQNEEGLTKALSSMDRVAAVELAHQYNQFKEDLVEWLNSFKGDEVVKVEDVQEFFSGVQARKRAKMDDGIPPNFCR
ncbi:putative E3 ubiquitin-protein ligase UBR7 [Daktulosphaira vitifoliae]|uniref:putative E3 ubiquitin-protein ligase UBR7 n=1 Tax=Daktulosphaira vitifoliae TaxID=58002 RepID=UPI0021AA4059|nr:putative E3 ubiquitin-protein ligase UBR7 [Daktulosphaira vitifoliae]XP_050539279.1 putative E3 ubiquitin-protein ligase UBR7 [Daktulosphaira vitifoliae]